MKHYLALGLLSSLLLTSFSVDWDDENVKKIGELEKQVQNDIFQKKQACIKLGTESQPFGVEYETMAVFFSEKINSCILSYAIDYSKLGGVSGCSSSLWPEKCLLPKKYIIQDLLNNRFILESENQSEYRGKIKELKGE